jgi:transposase
VRARTAQANQIRGVLAEFGIVIPQGIKHIAKYLPEIREDGENGLPGIMRQLLERLGDNLKQMDEQVGKLEQQIKLWHRDNEQSRKLEEIAGTSSALAC